MVGWDRMGHNRMRHGGMGQDGMGWDMVGLNRMKHDEMEIRDGMGMGRSIIGFDGVR